MPRSPTSAAVGAPYLAALTSKKPSPEATFAPAVDSDERHFSNGWGKGTHRPTGRLQPCKWFTQYGKCNYGSRCTFAHVAVGVAAPAPEPDAAAALDALPPTEVLFEQEVTRVKQDYFVMVGGDVLVPWPLLCGLRLAPGTLRVGCKLSGVKICCEQESKVKWLAVELSSAVCAASIEKSSKDEILGLVLEGSGPVRVQNIIQGGACMRNGVLHAGDEIQQVCGASVQSHLLATDILRLAGTGTLVIQFLRRCSPQGRNAISGPRAAAATQTEASPVAHREMQTEAAAPSHREVQTEPLPPSTAPPLPGFPMQIAGSMLLRDGDLPGSSWIRQCKRCLQCCDAEDIELFHCHACYPAMSSSIDSPHSPTFSPHLVPHSPPFALQEAPFDEYGDFRSQRADRQGNVGGMGRQARELESPLDRLTSTTKRILLCGEADFSFALSVASSLAMRQFDGRLVASSIEPEGVVYSRYAYGAPHVAALRQMPFASVCFGVDATALSNSFPSYQFDLIVFMFPRCTAMEKDKGDGASASANQELISRFLQSCCSHLMPRGAIQLALNASQFHAWDVRAALDRNGLHVVRKPPYDPRWFPGYRIKNGFSDAAYPLRKPLLYFVEKKRSDGHAPASASPAGMRKEPLTAAQVQSKRPVKESSKAREETPSPPDSVAKAYSRSDEEVLPAANGKLSPVNGLGLQNAEAHAEEPTKAAALAPLNGDGHKGTEEPRPAGKGEGNMLQLQIQQVPSTDSVKVDIAYLNGQD